jgi:hypothetical protein
MHWPGSLSEASKYTQILYAKRSVYYTNSFVREGRSAAILAKCQICGLALLAYTYSSG